jgi:hypothetical protein
VLKLVQFLQLNPRRVVRIEGYTDSTGANRKTSSCRAIVRSRWPTCWWTWDRRETHQVEGYGDQYPVEANASSGAGRRTVGWKSCSPMTRASCAAR